MPENTPEELTDPYIDGDPRVGRALRDFFLSLLLGKNLAAYHADRVQYIEEWVTLPPLLRSEEGVDNIDKHSAAELLLEETFVAIERHILAVSGSSRAKPLFVVSPPY